jgi:hypothetical protein
VAIIQQDQLTTARGLSTEYGIEGGDIEDVGVQAGIVDVNGTERAPVGGYRLELRNPLAELIRENSAQNLRPLLGSTNPSTPPLPRFRGRSVGHVAKLSELRIE